MLQKIAKKAFIKPPYRGTLLPTVHTRGATFFRGWFWRLWCTSEAPFNLRGSFLIHCSGFKRSLWGWMARFSLRGSSNWTVESERLRNCLDLILDQLTLDLGTKWVPSSALSVENLLKRKHFCTFTKIEHMTRQWGLVKNAVRVLSEKLHCRTTKESTIMQ